MLARVDAGVHVPRPHTEQFALRAAELLPLGGAAVDVCTESGAVAARAPAASPFCAPGGAVLLELGGARASVPAAGLDRLGFDGGAVPVDEDGDVRGIEATPAGRPSRAFLTMARKGT